MVFVISKIHAILYPGEYQLHSSNDLKRVNHIKFKALHSILQRIAKKLPYVVVEIKTEGETTTVEGIYYESPFKQLNIENPKNFCPTCPNKLGFNLHYTVISGYFISGQN